MANDQPVAPERIALKPREAAAALGISERKLWELSVSNQIPSFKLGSRRVYPVKELTEWASRSALDNA